MKLRDKRINYILLVIMLVTWGHAFIDNYEIHPKWKAKARVVEYTIKDAKTSENAILSVSERIEKASEGSGWTEILLRLAKCESTFDEFAVNLNTNGTYDLGVMQINSIHQDISDQDKLNVEESIRWSINKLNEGGLGIWVCSNKI